MKHYVVLCDWAVDNGEIANGVDVTGVAHSLKEAKEIFAKAVVDEKKYAHDQGWEIYEDTDVCFNAGEEGYYAAEHVRFYIQGVE
jgi:phosphoribosyl-dephospho-CoA transferase